MVSSCERTVRIKEEQKNEDGGEPPPRTGSLNLKVELQQHPQPPTTKAPLKPSTETPLKGIPLLLPPILEKAARYHLGSGALKGIRGGIARTVNQNHNQNQNRNENQSQNQSHSQSQIQIQIQKRSEIPASARANGFGGKRTIVAPGREEIALCTKPVDERVAKKQRRLIRNRVSAQMHRERKKKHVTELETRVAELTKTNKALLEKIASLTSSNQDMRKQLEVCTAKLRELEDMKFIAENSVQPESEPTSSSSLLPDAETSFTLLENPSDVGIEWESSVEDDDTAFLGSPPALTSEDADTVSDTESGSDSPVIERPRKQFRRGSKALSAACLAALVFTVSVIGDSMRADHIIRQDSGFGPASPRSLLDMVSDATRRTPPVVVDASKRLMASEANAEESGKSAEGLRSNGKTSTPRSSDHAKRNSSVVVPAVSLREKQYELLMQLAIRGNSRLLANRTSNSSSGFKDAIRHEIRTLTDLFGVHKSVRNKTSAKPKSTQATASKSLVLRDTEKRAAKEPHELDAVRAALNAYITHIGGSVRAEDLLQSYIMCPSAYGVLDTDNIRGSHSSSRESQHKGTQPRRRQRNSQSIKERKDLTLVVPSKSLYGAESDGIVQLHCQVQQVSDFLASYK